MARYLRLVWCGSCPHGAAWRAAEGSMLPHAGVHHTTLDEGRTIDRSRCFLIRVRGNHTHIGGIASANCGAAGMQGSLSCYDMRVPC